MLNGIELTKEVVSIASLRSSGKISLFDCQKLRSIGFLAPLRRPMVKYTPVKEVIFLRFRKSVN